MPAKKKDNSPRGPFINPFTDFGFKKIFGSEPNKDLLIDFLNELLREHKVQISNLTYKRTENLGNTQEDRKVIFDLYCENQQGEKFIVELQKAEQKFFKDRTVFYSTFPIQEQAPRGEWNYELKAVYAVAILDFAFNDEDQHKIVVDHVQLLSTRSYRVFYDKLTYVYVQMENFNKSIDELENHLDKWLYVLKHLDKFDRIPERIREKIFERVFQIAQYENLSRDEQHAYENSLKYYRDLKNSLDKAFEDGKQEVIELLQQAEAKVEQAEARAELERKQKQEAEARELEAKRKLARALLKMGESIENIMQETGLSAHEIQNL